MATRARILADYVSSGDELALKAPIAGPTFTGTVAIPNVANLETAVVANTAKTGITGGQASAITANTAKVTNHNQTLAEINALGITELGTVTSGTLGGSTVVSTTGVISSGTSAFTPTANFIFHARGTGADWKTFHSEIGNAGDRSHMYFTNPNGTIGSIGTNGSATSYYTSSDYRLKENVVAMSGSISRLKLLKPSRFNFIVNADITVDGFLGHEVKEVVPESVTGEKDAMTEVVLYAEGDELPEGKSIGDVKTASVPDMQGIDQSKLIPLLVGALQEAIARIETLEET